MQALSFTQRLDDPEKSIGLTALNFCITVSLQYHLIDIQKHASPRNFPINRSRKC